MALLLGVLLGLQACGTLGSREPDDADAAMEGEASGAESLSFQVEVISENRRIARYLREHLDIQRFRGFPDLQSNELRRLLGEARSNAQDLLAALGYFQPALSLRMDETGTQRRIIIEVDPGAPALVSGYEIGFSEPMGSDPGAAEQRESIRAEWSLKQNSPFTQESWDSAKTAGLRTLQRRRYPTARIAQSRATVNADTLRAGLAVTYDAGPLYRFGALKLEGLERHPAEGIHNIARIPTGEEYTETKLLDAQQRLVSSGYFDAVFLMLDPEEKNPEEATVIAQLREAKNQKAVFGLGYSTDSGARLTLDHTHNQMWPLGWRSVSRIELGTEAQSLSMQWTDMPGSSGWAWYTSGALERSDYGDYKANSISLTGGRLKSGEYADQRYYLQYDASRTEGSDSPGDSSSILGNYAWTGRYFDDRMNPTRGFGLAAETGLGFTLTPQQKPFLRFTLRSLNLLPFGGRNSAGRRGRFALRGELGAIYAEDDVDIPVTLLFLTGGDTTVRGYDYQSIGTVLEDGSTYGARYMATASVEWQRPITLFGDPRSFEHTIFVDSGTAADDLSDAKLYTGVGMGLRWSSPVGPMQADVAYGIEDNDWRLHIRMGFQF